MANQNYQNRNKNRKRSTQESSGAFRWMVITGLLIGLVVFGVYLKGNGLKKIKQHLPQNAITTPLAQILTPPSQSTITDQSELSPETVKKLEQPPDSLPPDVANELSETPQFEFYTTLSEKEVVVPEYEIMNRTRAEVVNPTTVDTTVSDAIPPVTSATKSVVAYTMQAGSFKNSSDAEKMCANLEAMGIEARVERGKVGETVYHRVKLGPYAQMNSVTTIRARLKQSGIDVIVTETATR